MRELMATSRLMVIVSHDLNTLRETCNRVIWLKQGRMVMEGASADVIREYKESVAAQAQVAKDVAKPKAVA
jgi:teichoic acid transport system ATP-binding protein